MGLKKNIINRAESYLKNSKSQGIPTGLALLYLPYKFLNKYLKNYYRLFFKDSIFFQEQEMGMCSLSPKKMIDKTIEMFKPGSVLDLGCGVGKSLDYFYSKDIGVHGIEGSKLAISKALHPEFIGQFNLNKELNLNRKFDLIWSFEFVEHIHPQYVKNLMKTFSNHSDNIVISAAQPGQGGEGHFNEQPPEYWINQFSECGYGLNKEKTEKLRNIDEMFSNNMFVFEKKMISI